MHRVSLRGRVRVGIVFRVARMNISGVKFSAKVMIRVKNKVMIRIRFRLALVGSILSRVLHSR